MTGAYALSPVVWPSLTAAILLAALSLYSLRHREVPGALPLAIGSFFASLWLFCIAFQLAAVAPETKMAWARFEAVCLLAGVTATTCFVLEYTQPGRWLTRRNVALLSLPTVLTLVIIVVDPGLIWTTPSVGADGSVVSELSALGLALMVYGLGLIVVNTAAFLWLFGRAPQYRWPVVIMLSGEVLSRALWFTSSGLFPAWNRIDSDIAAVIVVWAAYAVALFGFRILDPLSAARQTVIQQMREGMMVVDGSGRVVNLNPAAEAILGETGARLRGKTWRQALRLPSDAAALEPSALPSELTLTTGDISREYTLDLSPLKDPRGLDVGSLLLLLDVTEQRRAQAQAQQQQRALAVVRERERLARELHDDLGQVIGFVNTQGQAARRLLGHGEVDAADALLARLVEVAQEADTDLRESILGLRVAVDERGLLSAVSGYLAQYEKRYGIRTAFRASPDISEDAFEPAVEAQLLRIIQEALSNARKHARAGCVAVTIESEGGLARVTIEDDGCGFDLQQRLSDSGTHVGLRVMRERASEAGGALEAESAEGHGTRIVVTAPLRKNGNSGSMPGETDHARSAG